MANQRAVPPFLGQNIRAAREQLDLTQRELAVRLDCETALVNRWENGKHAPSRYYTRELVKVLGHDPEWFRTDHDDSPVAA